MTGYEMVKAIEAKMARTINNELGVMIEVTMRSEDNWTVCGSEADVQRAVDWLLENTVMRALQGEIEYDEELDEAFAYLQS